MNEETNKVLSIDPESLPKHFHAEDAEQRWDKVWEEQQLYRYDPTVVRAQTFVVDTPPPTVSGSLHIGHVFSYTHTDAIVRYKRMQGLNIFYPMGWDDNGLPTERRVQNYFHVACNPKVPYDPGLQLQQATEAGRKERAHEISRKNFIDLCLQLTEQDEQAFKALWRKIGLSVDWQEAYATIDEHCRHLAQYSFLDLFQKGHIYQHEAPTMWDVSFQTAVAQAELEDRPVKGAFYHVAFGVENSDRQFVIATTRPELLAACVAVTAHPDDSRYKDLFGKRALTPLFRVPVPIFPSELADPAKGTGILMVCTFGDQTDVRWWKEEHLALRQIIGLNGRLLPVTYGAPGWESLEPDAANAHYAQLVGKTVKAAQTKMVELLREPNSAAVGAGTALQGEPIPLTHDVKFYEKGDHPLEFMTTRQWFVRLLDKKELLMAKGNQIAWHPDHMRLRYLNWTENLQFDWCISRQRYFGVSFPVWYPVQANGRPDYDQPILARPDQLPVDPMVDLPTGYTEAQRDVPGGFTGESDVFDTWFTSSLTPQVGSHWIKQPDRHRQLFPMDIRPQAHDIIRTWAFYTIAKAALHDDTIPWKHVVLSGWILDPDRKKMSKSKGNVVTPMQFLTEYTADGVRYWACNARLGTDTAFEQNILKIGKRLVTKLFNAGKFVLANAGHVAPITTELDRAFVWKLRQLVEQATQALEDFDFASALNLTEQFFWQNFTDNYLELAKNRARGADGKTDAASDSAIAGLRLGLNVLLRLFAPMLPYITEEVWSWAFAQETGCPSIHKAPWPGKADFDGIDLPDTAESFDLAVACVTELRKYKTEQGLSLGREIEHLTLVANPAIIAKLQPVLDDVMASVRVQNYALTAHTEATEAQFGILNVTLREQA